MQIHTTADAFYISDPSDLFYLTHYKNNDAKILYFGDDRYYFTDARYFEEVESLPYIIKNIAFFYNFFEENNIKTLETDVSITLDEYEKLKEKGVEKIIEPTAQIASLRAVKTETEIGFIQKAQRITDKTFSDVLSYVKEDMTEKELDRILKSLLYQNGADDLAFDPIVAFGSNTSKPHAHPGDTRLKKGDLITLDFGAKYNNYCSDMTRTVAFGEPDEEIKTIYETVLLAQQEAIASLHAGITGAEAQKIVTDIFEERGVGEYFTHSLGHSLGIDIHENPCLSVRNNEPIPENAVTSVEPGLYFPKKFGVRIEDIVVFTKTGVRNLTNSEKKLIII
ncbi:MAG: aminopeptidase P family protein [Clostridia bacterium]|nr:aminopeptidase P family protein [Clostridia bacterium]